MAEGVDYSWARPGGAKLAANGKSFAVRYLWPGGGKGLTAAEVADLHDHGIAIAVVFERDAGRAGEGFAAGVADAQLAQSQLAAVGLPANLPIYFAVDFDTSWSNVSAYFAGVASVIGAGRTGVYGGIRVIQGAQSSGDVAWYWQTYAWSGGKRAENIHLYQYSNGEWGDSVDFTRSLADNFGQNGGAASVTVASSTPSQNGETMARVVRRTANGLCSIVSPGFIKNSPDEQTTSVAEQLYGAAINLDDDSLRRCLNDNGIPLEVYKQLGVSGTNGWTRAGSYFDESAFTTPLS